MSERQLGLVLAAAELSGAAAPPRALGAASRVMRSAGSPSDSADVGETCLVEKICKKIYSFLDIWLKEVAGLHGNIGNPQFLLDFFRAFGNVFIIYPPKSKAVSGLLVGSQGYPYILYPFKVGAIWSYREWPVIRWYVGSTDVDHLTVNGLITNWWCLT